MRQGTETIEAFYGRMTAIWKEIDRRVPNPMKHPEDITIFNEITQRLKLYQFLSGINETFDKDRRDILNKIPLPMVEEAYAIIRREISRREILTGKPSSEIDSSGIGSGLITKQKCSFENHFSGSEFNSKSRPCKIPNRREEDDKTHLHCTYCGGNWQTKDGCFKLIGFPDWWEEHQARKKGKDMSKKPDDRRKGGGSHAFLGADYVPEHGRGEAAMKVGEGNLRREK